MTTKSVQINYNALNGQVVYSKFWVSSKVSRYEIIGNIIKDSGLSQRKCLEIKRYSQICINKKKHK